MIAAEKPKSGPACRPLCRCVFRPRGPVQIDPLVIAAIAIGAIQLEGVPRETTVLVGEEHFRQPLLVQRAQIEGHEAELHCSIRASQAQYLNRLTVLTVLTVKFGVLL